MYAVVRLKEWISVHVKDVTISEEELSSKGVFEADAVLLPVAAEGIMMDKRQGEEFSDHMMLTGTSRTKIKPGSRNDFPQRITSDATDYHKT